MQSTLVKRRLGFMYTDILEKIDNGLKRLKTL